MQQKKLDALAPKLKAALARELRALATEVAHAREKQGYTQESLAEKLDVSPQMIQAIEQARKFPSLQMVLLLAHTLGIKITFGA